MWVISSFSAAILLYCDSLVPAHIWLRYTGVPKSPTTTHPLHPNLPVTLLWIRYPGRVRPGQQGGDEITMRNKSNDQTRGEDRSERRMAAVEKRRRQRGETDFKNNNSGKKTNNREKNKWEKRKRNRRSSEAPKVLKLIKMICIYLWALMSSFSIVCFPLIWIFPFHYYR